MYVLYEAHPTSKTEKMWPTLLQKLVKLRLQWYRHVLYTQMDNNRVLLMAQKINMSNK